MDWIFDGIGTEIIKLLISGAMGAIGGGVVGYKIGVKHTYKQTQMAGDSSNQIQYAGMKRDNVPQDGLNFETYTNQSQTAGNNAIQTQIGGINNDRR